MKKQCVELSGQVYVADGGLPSSVIFRCMALPPFLMAFVFRGDTVKNIGPFFLETLHQWRPRNADAPFRPQTDFVPVSSAGHS